MCTSRGTKSKLIRAVQRFDGRFGSLAGRSNDVFIMLIGWLNGQRGASGVSDAVVNDVGQNHGDGVRIGKPQTQKAEGAGEGDVAWGRHGPQLSTALDKPSSGQAHLFSKCQTEKDDHCCTQTHNPK